MTEKDRKAPVSMSEAKRLIYQMDPQALARYLCDLRESMDRKDARIEELEGLLREAVNQIDKLNGVVGSDEEGEAYEMVMALRLKFRITATLEETNGH